MNLVKKAKLSAIIHTRNSEKTLERTLRSVSFADEIVVVDMHSTDGTVALARRYTKAIYSFKDVGYVEPARNFGFSKASHPWLLVVDADEEISPQLRTVIEKALIQPKADVYFLPRKNLIFGEWIRRTGWWPDYHPRFFKKGALTWPETLHSVPEITGTQHRFPAEEQYALLHHNYDDVAQFIDRLNHYTTIQAPERLRTQPIDRFSTQQLFEIFANEFASRALARNGVQDGLHGTSLALLQAVYEATIYLKQWGEKGYPAVQSDDFGKTLDTMTRVWRYWWADYQVRHTSGLAQWYWRVRRKFQV